MQLPDRTAAVVDQLTEMDASEHFVIHYSLRTPPAGTPGRGSVGIRNPYLVTDYLDALERLYRVLTAPPFSWAKCPIDAPHVYAINLPSLGMREPFTTLDNSHIPYICLPCRSEDPTLEHANCKAVVEAVHEATHVFSWWARPPKALIEKKWFWFLEATAVFMEGYVFPKNPASIRFAPDWCDYPEWPLDEDYAWYQSSFFARYLAAKFGPGLISRIWNESLPTETPFTALNRMLLLEDASPSPNLCRVYGDYAHDCFFVWDRASHGFHNEVFLRFGHRAFTECYVLATGATVRAEWALDHLACRYYRIEIARGVRTLEAVFRSNDGDCAPFRCFLTAHCRTQRRGKWRELLLGEAGHLRCKLTAALRDNDLDDCEYFLLTVANCGIRSRATEPFGRPHDDDKTFTIEIRARA